MDYEVECPGCGAFFTVFVDPRGGDEQVLSAECPECRRVLTLLAKEEERGGFAIGLAQRDE
jgi:ribosomal protein S27E